MTIKNLFTAASLVLAGGCGMWAVGPDYKEPAVAAPEAPMPDAGSPTTNKTATGEFKAAASNEDVRAAITAASLNRWWMRFEDPILAGLVESAVSNNLSFLMARERLNEARWRLMGSAGDLFPHVNFAGSAMNKEAHRNNASLYSSHQANGTRASHSHTYRAGFDATWELDLFGGVRRDIEASHAAMEAAHWTVADAWVSLTAEIGSQYVDLRTTQRRLSVARTNLKLQSETYDILKSRLDSGIGDELAVNQAKYNVEQTRATIPGLLAKEETLMNALAILAGSMPGSLHALLRDTPKRDWLLEPQRLDDVSLDVMRARPDVRKVERDLAAQVASVGVAKSMLFPKFYLNGTLGMESVKIQKFLNRGSLYSSIGPSFSWPIFQGGAVYANYKAEEAKMDEAVLRYELTLQKAYADVRNAYAAYTQEYHRFQSLQGAVKAATDAVNISKDLYKNGLADFNNVLDAQRSLLTLEEALTVSRGLITTDLIALYKALGGGLVMEETETPAS